MSMYLTLIVIDIVVIIIVIVDRSNMSASLVPIHDVLRSKSSDCLRNVQTQSLMIDNSDEQVWRHQRTRSLSDTEKTLDALMKSINDMLSEDLPSSHRRHSSNDSAMGESECITSPCQHHIHNDIAYHVPSMYNSVDSAISNHSSSNHFSSCEGVSYTTADPPSSESTSTYTLNTPHIRMYSEPSVQSDSPQPSQTSPMRVNSPKFTPKTSPYYCGSLPVLTPDIDSIISHSRRSSSPLNLIRKIRKSSSTNSGKGFWSKKRHLNKSNPMGSLEGKMPEYHLQRSPLLGRKFDWEPVSNTNITSSSPTDRPSVLEVLTDETIKELVPRFHFVIQPLTEVLI